MNAAECGYDGDPNTGGPCVLPAGHASCHHGTTNAAQYCETTFGGNHDERDGSSTVDEWNDPAWSGIRIANAAQRLFNAGELPTSDAIDREIRKGAHR
jgi:hypothetical protein